MRYVSLFSGIEAASVAWEPLGWEPVAFCEIDGFPSAVLAARFPDVENVGDITKVDWRKYAGAVDLVVGGSPCQSFSIAGNREGLAGESGLMFEYIRAVREIMPRYFVWENVPGALSCERGGLSDSFCPKWMGSGTAWRGEYWTRNSSEWPSDAAVCFLSDVLETRDVPRKYFLSPKACAGILRRAETRGKPLPPIMKAALESVATPSKCDADDLGGGKGALIQEDVSATLSTSNVQTLFQPCYAIQGDIARGAHMGQNGKGYSDDGACYTLNTIDQHAICMADDNARSAIDENLSGSLKVGGSCPAVTFYSDRFVVRRLTPTECERLQGFPDGWTDAEFKGKPASDTARYKALGNSMAVPVMRWIGQRIDEIERRKAS